MGGAPSPRPLYFCYERQLRLAVYIGDRSAGAVSRLAGAFVWGAWLVMTVAATSFVARYGPSLPRWDDFDVVPVAIGERPLTIEWLWSQHNEHRLPLPRLALLGAYRVSGGDFRAGMFLGVLVLGLAAAALMLAAAALRGRASLSDALFPVALLHWGHYSTWLLSWQLQFALSTALACAVLIAIVVTGGAPSVRRSALVGASLILLPLCGANGLVLVPALSVWFLALGFSQRHREAAGRRSALVVVVWIVAMVVVTLLYARGYRGLSVRPAGGSMASTETAVEFLTLVGGPAVAGMWPISGLVVVAVLSLTGALLARKGFVERAERLRTSGLLCFVAAMVSLAASIGWGRAETIHHAGLSDRYVTLAVPLLCATSFAWQIHGGAIASRWVPMALLMISVLLLWPNSIAGLAHGRATRATARAFERDVAGGMPRYKLVRRYTPFLYPRQETLAAYLEMLRRRGIPEFAPLRDDPPFREIPVHPEADRMIGVRSSDGAPLLVDAGSQLFFTLAPARKVAGVRLRDSLVKPGARTARFRVSWAAEDDVFDTARQYSDWLRPTGRDRTTTIWIDDRVKRLRIEPDDEPARYEVHELTLLVPAETAP